MTADQIAAWAAAGGCETVEFKHTTDEQRAATRTPCAMLNHRGGLLLFGVESDGRVVGQQISDETIEDVARIVIPCGNTGDRVHHR